MFKVFTTIGVQLILAGVAIGLTPVNAVNLSCGSPFKESNPPPMRDATYRILGQDCVKRREGRHELINALLILGGAALLGGAAGMIADRERRRTVGSEAAAAVSADV
jgi:hypothetical protein